MIKVSISRSTSLVKLIAYEKNVYQFKFTGDKTYTDDLGVVFDWVGIVDLSPVILGIRSGEQALFVVESLQDCIDTPGSFYYAPPRLYVHWPQGQHDIGVSRSLAVVSTGGNIDVADSFRAETLNWEGELFYEPSLDSVSEFGLRVDPLKFSIVQSFQSTATINNASGAYNNLPLTLARGSIMQVSDDDEVLFKGITENAEISEDKVLVTAMEQRFFRNPRVCQNSFTSAAYPNIPEKLIGTPIPVAIGMVSRIKLTPLNTKNMNNASIFTVEFLVSDPGFNNIKDSGILLDSSGNPTSIASFELNSNVIRYSKPADTELKLEEFTWSGQVGDITDGLGIIQFAYQNFAIYPFIPGLFDVEAWNLIRSVNQQPVGIQATGTQDLLSSIVEPICTSLQCMILTNKIGEITAVQRGFDLSIKKTIEPEEMEGISYDINSESFVPEVIVSYGNNSDKFYIEDSQKQSIIENYGNVANGKINPIVTVLANQSDAQELAEKIMQTSKQPEKVISFAVPYALGDPALQNLKPFDVILADGEGIEVYSIVKNIYTQRVDITGRLING
jgi:hypothetical protein